MSLRILLATALNNERTMTVPELMLCVAIPTDRQSRDRFATLLHDLHDQAWLTIGHIAFNGVRIPAVGCAVLDDATRWIAQTLRLAVGSARRKRMEVCGYCRLVLPRHGVPKSNQVGGGRGQK
jgi:hypothetical protein